MTPTVNGDPLLGECSESCALSWAAEQSGEILTLSPRSPFAPGTPCKILNGQVTCNTALSHAEG